MGPPGPPGERGPPGEKVETHIVEVIKENSLISCTLFLTSVSLLVFRGIQDCRVTEEPRE